MQLRVDFDVIFLRMRGALSPKAEPPRPVLPRTMIFEPSIWLAGFVGGWISGYVGTKSFDELVTFLE